MHVPAAAATEGVMSTDTSTTNVGENVAENWRLWCRLCAKEDSQSNISVFFKNDQRGVAASTMNVAGGANQELSLKAAIQKYFWVNIKPNEDMPEMLCTECFSLVTSIVNFGERVSKVQKMYGALHNTTGQTKSDLDATRLKYGLLDEERELVMLQHPLSEVLYFETEPKTSELEEQAFETAPTVRNPLEPPYIDLKIKDENMEHKESKVEDHHHHYEDHGHYHHHEDHFSSSDYDEDNNTDEDYCPIKASSRNKFAKYKQGDYKFTKKIKGEAPSDEDKQPLKKRILRSSLFSLDNEEKSPDEAPPDEAAIDLNSNGDVDIFSCVDCTATFNQVEELQNHMKRTHSEVDNECQALTCPQCSRVFTSQCRLKRHVSLHSQGSVKKKDVPCPYCRKKIRSNTLHTHIKYMHLESDVRPFVCEECGVAVRTNAALKSHMLTHTDYAPFVCDVCQKGFKNLVRLKKHLEIHDPNKHICAECGMKLNSRKTYNHHLLVHSDKMHHKCDYCGRAFKRSKTLKNHLIKHTGLKPYSCDFCERSFAFGPSCRAHKKRMHPEALAALEASGGGKIYTLNIPKLDELKALTKAAGHLTPVGTRKFGGYGSCKKPKLDSKESGDRQTNTDGPESAENSRNQ